MLRALSFLCLCLYGFDSAALDLSAIDPASLNPAEESDRLGDDRIEDPRLIELNRSIEAQSTDLKLLDDRITKLAGEQGGLKKELDLIRRDMDRSRQQLDESEREHLLRLAEVAELRGRLKSISQLSARRLRGFYLMRFKQRDLVLLSSGRNAAVDDASLGRLTYSLRKLDEFDRSLIAQYSEIEQELDKKLSALDGLVNSIKAAQALLAEKAAALDSRSKKNDVILKDLKSKRSLREQSISALRADLLRLEVAIASFVEQQNAQAAVNAVRNAALKSGKEDEQGDVTVGRDSASESKIANLLGLTELKGRLPWPMSGGIPGKIEVSEQDTTLEQLMKKRGIRIGGNAGAEVKAVAPGVVVFRGNMPGYGPVVVIDHGQRWHSLYAGVQPIEVLRGQTVTAGQELGQLARSANPFLYFEIRKHGKVVTDPEKFLVSTSST